MLLYIFARYGEFKFTDFYDFRKSLSSQSQLLMRTSLIIIGLGFCMRRYSCSLFSSLSLADEPLRGVKICVRNMSWSSAGAHEPSSKGFIKIPSSYTISVLWGGCFRRGHGTRWSWLVSTAYISTWSWYRWYACRISYSLPSDCPARVTSTASYARGFGFDFRLPFPTASLMISASRSPRPWTGVSKGGEPALVGPMLKISGITLCTWQICGQ